MRTLVVFNSFDGFEGDQMKTIKEVNELQKTVENMKDGDCVLAITRGYTIRKNVKNVYSVIQRWSKREIALIVID